MAMIFSISLAYFFLSCYFLAVLNHFSSLPISSLQFAFPEIFHILSQDGSNME